MVKLILCIYFTIGIILSIIMLEIITWVAKNYADEVPTCRKAYEELERIKASGHFAVVPVSVLLLACMWPGWIIYMIVTPVD